MALKKINKNAVPFPASLWDVSLGISACILVFFVPFFPDEKLVRLKMQALELGLLAMALLAGLRIALTSSLPFSLGAVSEPGNDQGKWSPWAYLILAVVLWLGAQSLLWFLSSEKALASPEIRRILWGGCAFLIVLYSFFALDWIRRVLTCWACSAGLLALYGCLQVTGGFGIIQVPQMERIAATYGNPIFFAAFLLPSLFLSVSAYYLNKGNILRFFLAVGIVFQGAALYFTKTRASWIGFAAALLLGYIIHRKDLKISKVFILFVLMAGALFAHKTRDVWQRDQGHLLIWRDTLRMWTDKPVLGVGLGSFHTTFPAYAQNDLKSKWPQGQFIVNYAHNEYLQMLVEGGLVGLLFFLFVVFSIFRYLVLFFRSSHESSIRIPLLFLVMGFSSLLVQNFFSVDMRFSVSFISCFMMAALAVSMTGAATAPTPLAFGWSMPVRWMTAGLWSVFLTGVVLPVVIRPYKAQKIVSETPGFFDERLLDPAKSIQDLEALAKQYPMETAVLDKLAYVYAKEMKTSDNRIHMGMAQAAIRTYEQIIRVDPHRLSAYNNMANINYTMGKSDEAISLWRKCVEIDPSFLDPHLNLGKTLYVKGELKASARHFQKVLELSPGNSEAIVYLKRMVE